MSLAIVASPGLSLATTVTWRALRGTLLSRIVSSPNVKSQAMAKAWPTKSARLRRQPLDLRLLERTTGFERATLTLARR